MSASPQKENGYIPIANEIAEALAKINLSPYENRILWVIFRKTYGWQKKIDKISLSQFKKETNISISHICRALKKLKAKQIVTQIGNGYYVTYSFQKDYHKWKPLPKQAITSQKYGENISEVKEKIREKYNRKCVLCDKSEEYKSLAVHHIDYNERNYEEENLILLCNSCHGKTNRNHTHWIELFKSIGLPKQVIGITQTGNKLLPKQADTKDIKDTIQKTNTLRKVKNPLSPAQKHFYDKYKETFGKDYIANFGKDGAIFKDLNKIIPENELFGLIDKFMASEDEFIKKSGYTTGVFKSQINKLQVKTPLITFRKE